MDDEFFAMFLVKERLAEARACAARQALLRARSVPARSFRVRLGLALVRLGQQMAGFEGVTRGESLKGAHEA
jgi:hypothetical protein